MADMHICGICTSSPLCSCNFAQLPPHMRSDHCLSADTRKWFAALLGCSLVPTRCTTCHVIWQHPRTPSVDKRRGGNTSQVLDKLCIQLHTT